jgi:hypothetical protein
MPGQRYRAQARWAPAMQVIAVVEDGEGVPHAKLVAVKDRHETRTVSCLALRNRRLWQKLADPPGFGIAAE